MTETQSAPNREGEVMTVLAYGGGGGGGLSKFKRLLKVGSSFSWFSPLFPIL
jgi:hypothetical protein